MDSSGKSFNPHKHLKEQFVSNLKGSSMLEIFLLTTTLSVGNLFCFLFLLIVFSIADSTEKEASLKKNDDRVVVSESLRAYMAGIIVLSEWISLSLALVIFLLLISLAAKRLGLFHQENGVISLRENVSSYRVSMMLLTCLCILAVDFKIYPRRYAKAETYGAGLMDLGVGSFVLANSFVSRQAQGVSKMSVRNAVRSSSPLILLGFARLIFTSGVDYQVHVGEYGVHWNFFFTLAAVAILTSLVNLPPKYCGILGILILAGYQYVLLHGLNEYLLSDERGTDIISLNKEGIFSIFGYWATYLVGVQLGSYLLFENHAGNTSRANKRAGIRVCILCLLFWSLTLFLDQFVEKVSRRMCNMTYVTLVLATNLQVLAITMISGSIPGSKLSVLEEAFNQNLLGSFLLANVLTGLINLSIDTLFVSSTFALATLLVYALTLSLFVGSLHFYGIKLKFW
ncbi:hypothetical protein M9H77_00622 [Catharanthus roseus]|nr:hypothetical protein M9H77_00622 [Catharanthus roseus]